DRLMHLNGFYHQDQDGALRCDFHPGQRRAWNRPQSRFTPTLPVKDCDHVVEYAFYLLEPKVY
ncbi:hypothetical protein ACFLXI_09455, partial [Chloroflexota bacterium]